MTEAVVWTVVYYVGAFLVILGVYWVMLYVLIRALGMLFGEITEESDE